MADQPKGTESAPANIPVATPEEAAQTQDRFGSFVAAPGAESGPALDPYEKREAWLNRINYQGRRQRVALLRRKLPDKPKP